MALYVCAWCGKIIRERHLAFVAGPLKQRVHGMCAGPWLEIERLFGRPVLGEPPFRPSKRGRKGLGHGG